MRPLSAVVPALGILLATFASPRDASAGCSCGCGGCEYSALNSARCTYDGGCLCSLGGGGQFCIAPPPSAAAFDGTISNETRVAAVQARDVLLTHRGCDGGIVRRQYSLRMSARLRGETLRIEI